MSPWPSPWWLRALAKAGVRSARRLLTLVHLSNLTSRMVERAVFEAYGQQGECSCPRCAQRRKDARPS